MLTIQENFPLQSLNTFGMKVYAEKYSELTHQDDWDALYDYGDKLHKILVLGGGSNMLFKGNVNYWVLHNRLKGIQKIKEDENAVWLQVAAGEIWHQFVLYCVQHQLAGVENLSLIPGTVGAAPIQNIGAYGVEVKDVIASVSYWNIAARCKETLSNHDCRFAYRDSIFKQELKGQIIITDVVFRLNKKPQFHLSYGNIRQELERMGITDLSIRAVSDAVIHIRKSKLPDPAITGNAGSFFKNPEIGIERYNTLIAAYPDMPAYPVGDAIMKIPAGWLIEQCGWKGFRRGNYGVHPLQALVLVNYGGASGKDIYNLSSEIVQSVEDKFGIRLDREVQII